MRTQTTPLPAPLALALALGPTLVACHAGGSAEAGLAPTGNAERAIEAASLLADVRALSDDAFEGRSPGGVGEERTIELMSRRFAEAGAAPGNPDGTWVQRVPLVGLRDLVFADPSKKIGDVARPALSVKPETSLDKLEDFFDEHDIAAVMVVEWLIESEKNFFRSGVEGLTVVEGAEARHERSQAAIISRVREEYLAVIRIVRMKRDAEQPGFEQARFDPR